MNIFKKINEKNCSKIKFLGIELYKSEQVPDDGKKRKVLYGIYSSKKNIYGKRYRILGFPVYTAKLNDPEEIKGKAFFGIFTTRENPRIKKIKFLGIPFLITHKTGAKWTHKLFGIPVYKSNPKNNKILIKAPLITYNNLKDVESEELKRPTPVQLARKLLKYDVISFDIFDTLIFRPFEVPSDLFYIIGSKLQIANFKDIRVSKEREARDITENPNREVNIFDIYELLSKAILINKEEAIKLEFETEKNFCFANPYMKQVFNILKQNNKKVIATSDMYWPKEYMIKLLEACGYTGFDEIFVSCDCLCAKRQGKLQSYIKGNFYKNEKFIHIGDNFQNDVLDTRAVGLEAIHYPNVNAIGKKYRPADMSAISGSIYKGLVNAYIHNGLMKKDKYYQHGFIVGGFLTYGFCQHIEKYALTNNIDKILFVTRDGDIIHKVYKKYFGQIKHNMIFASRNALAKLCFGIYTEDYIVTSLLAIAIEGKSKTIDILKKLDLDILF